MSIKIMKNTMIEPTEITCKCCGSILSYTYDDIRRKEESTFLGIVQTVHRYIVCPVCKSDIFLPSILEYKKDDDNDVSEQ